MPATAYDSCGRTGLRSLNCDGGLGVALLLAVLLLLGLAAGGASWRLALQYQRTAIAGGEWWRLLTGHLVHLGVRHALLDIAGLVLLWVLYARALRPAAWGCVLAGSILGIDAGLWWLAPGVQWYAGLSGVLHGAWAAGAAGTWREGRGLAGAALGLLALKLLAEQLRQGGVGLGPLPVVVDAHLYGALGGLLAVLAFGAVTRRL